MTTIHCFSIPALNPEPAQSELNIFLARERVLALRREFIADGAHSHWAFCVELASGPGSLPDALRVPGSRAGPGQERAASVDYKQVLSEPDFRQFAALRELRKRLAQADGVPVFAVFTNEHLAAFVTRRASTLAALGEVDGVGPSRLDKYGPAVLACLQAHPPQPPQPEPAAP